MMAVHANGAHKQQKKCVFWKGLSKYLTLVKSHRVFKIAT